MGIVSAQAPGVEDGSTASAAFFTVEVVVSVVAAEVSMAVAVDGVAAVMAAAGEEAVVIVETAGPTAPSLRSAATSCSNTQTERH